MNFHFKVDLYSILVITCVIFTKNGVRSEENTNVTRSNEFDFLVFAQIWPITSCIGWEERDSHNTCTLPNRKTWTVHGLWPSKLHSMGPFNCRPDQPFDENSIKSILPELRIHWTNVRANTPEDNFWEHEWNKHGTCAMVLPEVNSELKYFQTGLDFNKRFDIKGMLSDSNIVPGNQYKPDKIIEALKKNLGVNPGLQCVYDHEIHEHLLYQINVCLDKNFNVMGCEDSAGKIYGECPHHKEILYPKTEKLNSGGHGAGTTGHSVGAIIGGIFAAAIVLAIIAYFARKFYLERTRARGYESL